MAVFIALKGLAGTEDAKHLTEITKLHKAGRNGKTDANAHQQH